MTNAFASLPPGWFQARRYHLIAPLVALAIVAFFAHFTTLIDRLEYMTVSMRFQARAAHDPPADPRLVFVAIDDASLRQIGKWVWPRAVEAGFLREIAQADAPPHTIAFDIMFTEETDKLNLDVSGLQQRDDAALGEAMAELPSVITGAFSAQPPDQKDLIPLAEKKTREGLADAGPTQPLTNIRGNVGTIPGSNVADLPVAPVRTQSLFGFVNDNPSPVDGIRHTLPLVLRVGDKVYPSLSLQMLCQMLNVDADKVAVDLPAHQIRFGVHIF